MATELVQIVSYTDKAVREKIERDVERSATRASISSIIHHILRSHYFPTKPKK